MHRDEHSHTLLECAQVRLCENVNKCIYCSSTLMQWSQEVKLGCYFFWPRFASEIHAEQEWPTGWNVGYNIVSWLKSKTQRLCRHCALWDGLPVSTQAWFITSIRSVFHDTLFFHLSNYTALMCSFSPASRLSPPLITHFGPWCLVVAQTLISSLMFPLKSATVPGSIGTHTCCAAFCCRKLARVVWYIASQ